MKKLTLIISALALVLGLSQCKKPNVPEYNGPIGGRIIQEVTLNASHGGNDNSNSKVSYEGEGLTEIGWVMKFTWDVNDQIIAYDSDGYCGTLTLKEGEGSPDGVFKGSLNVTVGSDVTFYYFGKNVTDNGGHSYSVDFGTQNGCVTSEPENPLNIIGKLVLVGTSAYEESGAYNATMGLPFSVVKVKFQGFGESDITFRGMESTGFNIDNVGKLTLNQNTTVTLKAPGTKDFFLVCMPNNTKKYLFSDGNKVADASWELKKNTFYTKAGTVGDPVLIEARTASDGTISVATELVCPNDIFSCGGKVTLSKAQVCEFGVVYSENVASPEIGVDGCKKSVGGTEMLPATTTQFTIDITDFQANKTYKVRAYAIGEKGVVVYAENIVEIDGNNKPQPIPDSWNNGASPYSFEISNDNGTTKTYVKFSQGNLQYHTNTDKTWRFANHQFDMVHAESGYSDIDYAETSDKWIDLFGWGTSGWNNNNTYYMPYSKDDNGNENTGYGYGPRNGGNYNISLTGSYANADWGVYNNTIKAGETSTNGWRTLTINEWDWLINGRANHGNLYGKGTVGCIKGAIILPDNWTGSNLVSGGYDANNYSYAQWHNMEAAGAVFLPAAGYRAGGTIDVQYRGLYWSSSCYNSTTARSLDFNPNSTNVMNNNYQKFLGFSVRLVRNAE